MRAGSGAAGQRGRKIAARDGGARLSFREAGEGIDPKDQLEPADQGSEVMWNRVIRSRHHHKIDVETHIHLRAEAGVLKSVNMELNPVKGV